MVNWGWIGHNTQKSLYWTVYNVCLMYCKFYGLQIKHSFFSQKTAVLFFFSNSWQVWLFWVNFLNSCNSPARIAALKSQTKACFLEIQWNEVSRGVFKCSKWKLYIQCRCKNWEWTFLRALWWISSFKDRPWSDSRLPSVTLKQVLPSLVAWLQWYQSLYTHLFRLSTAIIWVIIINIFEQTVITPKGLILLTEDTPTVF